jgi:hypothetical protein
MAFGNFMKILFFLTLFLSVSCLAKREYETPSSPPLFSTPGIEAAPCQHSFKDLNLCYDLRWEKLPTEDEAGAFKLHFYSALEKEAAFFPEDMELEVVLWMPSMGHGSTPVEISREHLGVFVVQDVYFIMPGEWDIEIHLKKGSTLVAKSLYFFYL